MSLDGAIIHHGPLSQRIYLMKLGAADPVAIASKLVDMAREHDYTKIFVKAPHSASEPFLRAGYQLEARVPGFYKGTEDACFVGYYLSRDRQEIKNATELEDALTLSRRKATASAPNIIPPPGFRIRLCDGEDVNEMSAIYSEVFPSYPFPIDDPAFLLETMRSHVDYYGVEYEGKLVALSSAEMDKEGGNVEMTDFATLPQWRGHGLAVCLLSHMEQAMFLAGFITSYTIARAISAGMNVTFAKMGYKYGGRLINNTNISGTIESMNVWYKTLANAPASAAPPS